MEKIFDCIVIGGGQSGLASAYFLRREKLNFIILDAEEKPGGAWLHGWDSLTLFSPAEFSSLPGMMMPKSKGKFPSIDEVIDYLSEYEKRYDFSIKRSVFVQEVKKENTYFTVMTNKGDFKSHNVICATGTFKKPFIPQFKGLENFTGEQIHSKEYRNPQDFAGKHVLIVGEGNSGAQLLAELANHTVTYWAVKSEPEFLPDDVDGRVLFDSASAIYYAKQKGEKIDQAKINLGNIVMVPSVKKAFDEGVFNKHYQIDSFTRTGVVWKNGKEVNIDVVIWCTGFGYNLDFVKNLASFDEKGRTQLNENESKEVSNLFFVGYGGWTGFASATLIGVGRTAKKVAKKIALYSETTSD
jgi:cation diffusion facilitator CzcD-associated flavoprotein CzcO